MCWFDKSVSIARTWCCCPVQYCRLFGIVQYKYFAVSPPSPLPPSPILLGLTSQTGNFKSPNFFFKIQVSWSIWYFKNKLHTQFIKTFYPDKFYLPIKYERKIQCQTICCHYFELISGCLFQVLFILNIVIENLIFRTVTYLFNTNLES